MSTDPRINNFFRTQIRIHTHTKPKSQTVTSQVLRVESIRRFSVCTEKRERIHLAFGECFHFFHRVFKRMPPRAKPVHLYLSLFLSLAQTSRCSIYICELRVFKIKKLFFIVLFFLWFHCIEARFRHASFHRSKNQTGFLCFRGVTVP